MDPQGTGLLSLFVSSSWGSCFVVQITIRKPRRPRHLCKITNFGVLLVDNPRPGEAQQWPWWVLAGQRWRHGCLLGGCWPAMETWVLAEWVLASNGDIGTLDRAVQPWRWNVCCVGADHHWRWSVHWVGADQPWRWSVRCVGADCSADEAIWRPGCVLAGCSSAMETWVCACWLLTSNGDMGVCLFVAEQQQTHE